MRHQSRYVTAKEIAAELEVTDRHVRAKRNDWGLDACEDRSCARPLRFRRDEAREKLIAKGFDVEF